MIVQVIIAGAHSSCGKTTLAARLLQGPCKGFAAVKVTPVRAPLEVISSPERILRPGKDTWVMAQAGAATVLWLRAPRAQLSVAWTRASALLGGTPGVVIEGNSAVDFANPALVLFVLDLMGPVKARAHALMAKAHAWVVNCRKGVCPAQGFQSVKNSIEEVSGRASGPIFFVDLAERGDGRELLAFVGNRLGTTAARERGY